MVGVAAPASTLTCAIVALLLTRKENFVRLSTQVLLVGDAANLVESKYIVVV